MAAAVAAPDLSQSIPGYDMEEDEIRGNLTFKPVMEVLPKTKRTERLHEQKIQQLQRRVKEAEDRLKQKEQEEAAKRKEANEKKKAAQERKKREEELARKKREEEEMRKKAEGGLDQLLDALSTNSSRPDVTACGIELNATQVRLLANSMRENQSCMSLNVSRKGFDDDDGVAIAEMLETNKYLQKLEMEGNNLGMKAAEAFGESLRKNSSLRSLNLESNNLAHPGGTAVKGVIELANALKVNTTLRVLMLGKNAITGTEVGEYLVSAIEASESLTVVDLSGNDLSVEQLRRIDSAVQRNRERLSEIRRAERRERFELYNEEFKCRQYDMQVEAMRLEIEAHEERKLNRMKARFEKWVEEIKEMEDKEKTNFEDLMSEAADRAEANKGKKGKKGKKK